MGRTKIEIGENEVSNFKNGKCKISVSNFYGFNNENGLWGYINLEGKTVIPILYENADDFTNGFGLVEQNGMRFYVDEKGTRYLQE